MTAQPFGHTALAGYILSMAWYVWDAWEVFEAVDDPSPYPFFLMVDTVPTAFFSLGGTVYWVAFGLDRSGTPASIAGYLLAGAHILVFALQVWLGPSLWAMKNLT